MCLVVAGPAAARDTDADAEARAASGGAAQRSVAATRQEGAASKAVVRLEGMQLDAMAEEIATAGFYELVARARELGLSSSGSADDLRSRLREYYGIEASPSEKEGRTITIERAGNASYSKVEEGEGGIIRASGGVILSLVETNGDKHSIRADQIVYDRDHSTLTARGSVRYERSSSDVTEVFAGEALSADIEDWSGVFIDGKLRKAGEGDASGNRGIVIGADTIVRRSTDVMVLKDGVISSCDEEDPHYKVQAGRVWLLGDKDWAVADALFSLGNVPILWLPFFYYPGDELVFHPVIGYRSREGRFVQTTTYLIGAKPASTTTTSILSFKDTGVDKPTQLKGLYLRRVKGTRPKDEGTLKVMADLYSGLGAFAGLQGSLSKIGFLSKTDLFLGLGLSRSLFDKSSTAGIYTPFVADGKWESVWNSSDFFGFKAPFRYGLDISTAMQQGGISASLALPLYSDPFFDYDFRNRSEDMDWFKILSTDTATTVSTRSQLQPNASLSFSYAPKALSPLVSSISLTKLNSYITILNQTATIDENSTLYNADSRRLFYYPSILRPFDAALSIKGTILTTESKSSSGSAGTEDKKKKAASEAEQARIARAKAAARHDPEAGGSYQKLEQESRAGVEAEAAAKKSQELRNPWGVDEEGAAGEKGADAADDEAQKAPVEDFRLPALAKDVSSSSSQDWSGSLNWSLTPTMYDEYRYRNDSWTSPEKIDYALLYQLYSYSVSGGLDGNLSYRGDLVSGKAALTYENQNQWRPILYDDGTGTAATYSLADKLYKLRRIGASSSVTTKPLLDYWLWSGSSITWAMDASIYQYKYNSTDSVFRETWLSWAPESISTHNVTAVLALRPDNLTQSLTFIAALPPTYESYTAKLGLDAGLASFRIQSRMYKKEETSTEFSYEPITTGLSIGKSPGPVLSDSFAYNAVENDSPVGAQSNALTFSWDWFSATYDAKRSYQYTPTRTSWIASSDESFVPYDVAFSLAPVLKSADGSFSTLSFGSSSTTSSSSSTSSSFWSLGANVAFSQSIVKFSNSSLSFGLNSSVKLGDALTLSLSSNSVNSAAWRYYPGLFASQLESINIDPSQYYVNFFADVWNGLKIWDKKSLLDALFKLKSLSLKVTRDLHDWTLTGEVSTAPLLHTDKTYSLEATISILLQWKDIPAIKTNVKRTPTTVTDAPTLSY